MDGWTDGKDDAEQEKVVEFVESVDGCVVEYKETEVDNDENKNNNLNRRPSKIQISFVQKDERMNIATSL